MKNKQNSSELYCPLTFQWMTQKGKLVLAMHPCIKEKCALWKDSECQLKMIIKR